MNDITYKYQIKHDHSAYSIACGKERDEAVNDIKDFAKTHKKRHIYPEHHRGPNLIEWENELRSELHEILNEDEDKLKDARPNQIDRIIHKYPQGYCY